MKTISKWIPGIVVVLLLLAVLAGAGFMWRRYTLAAANPALSSQPGWNVGPMMHGYGDDRRAGPMMGGDGFHHTGRGFMPFGGFFFLGGLACLLFFGLLLYGAYWLGRRNARLVLDRRSDGPAEPVASAPPDEVPPAS